jgi:hypothetical protein
VFILCVDLCVQCEFLVEFRARCVLSLVVIAAINSVVFVETSHRASKFMGMPNPHQCVSHHLQVKCLAAPSVNMCKDPHFSAFYSELIDALPVDDPPLISIWATCFVLS